MTTAMTDRERAARAIGYLEGFSAWIWDNVGEHLDDEFVHCYDLHVDELCKAIFNEEGDGNERG